MKKKYQSILQSLNNHLTKSFINIKLSIGIFIGFLSLNLADRSPFPFQYSLVQFDNSIGKEILGDIIKSSAGILGVTVTILIISLQLLRNKFDDYAINALFKNRALRNIITLFSSAVILPFFTLLFLSGHLDVVDYNRIYFSLIVFVITFIYLFGSLPKIIKSTTSTEVVNDLVDEIDKMRFIDFIKAPWEDSLSRVKKKERNPLVELQNIAVLAARNDDEIFLEQIIEFRVVKIKEILQDSISNKENSYFPGNITNTYLEYFLRPIVERVMNNERLINLLIGEAREIILFCAKPGLLRYAANLNGYLLNILSHKVLNGQLFKSTKTLIDDYELIINEMLRNYDNAVDLEVLKIGTYNIDGVAIDASKGADNKKKAEDFEKRNFEIEFDAILNMINGIQVMAIELKYTCVVETVNGVFQRTILEILHSRNFNLTDEQQQRLLYYFLYLLKKVFINAVNANLFHIDKINRFFNYAVMANSLLYGKLGSSIAVKLYLETILVLSEEHVLLKDLFDGVRNPVKFACEHFIKDLPTNQESLDNIWNYLEKILGNVNKRDGNIDEQAIINEQIILFRAISEPFGK